MTATLNDVNSSKRKSEPSSEEKAAPELVKLAKEQGLSLTGSDGLLKQSTKHVLETALNEEIAEHLGHEKSRAEPERQGASIRNGTRSKTVLTEATGQVEIDMPRDREGTFSPQIVKKRQRRLTEVDEIVLSLYAKIADTTCSATTLRERLMSGSPLVSSKPWSRSVFRSTTRSSGSTGPTSPSTGASSKRPAVMRRPVCHR